MSTPPPAPAHGDTERAAAAASSWGPYLALHRLARRHPYLVATLGFAAFSALLFRDGWLGSSTTLPEGSNALNAWLNAWYFQQRPLAMWVFPFTDWGQPYPGFTGPTILTPALVGLPPTVLVRGIELVSFVSAGLGMMACVRSLGGTSLGGALAGFYYLTFAETTQYFEGHVPAMISVALAPPFLVALWHFLHRPTIWSGIIPAALLYLLVSIGDLGMLYFYLFFATLIAGFAIVRRWRVRFYSLPEFAAIAWAVVLVATLSLSWLYPFALGVRPQYTTNISVGVIPFRDTFAENIAYAFSGYVQDNAFIHFTYHQDFYSLGQLTLLPLFLVLPVLLTLYAFVGRRPTRMAAYGSAVLAMVFSTGSLYPGLSEFNALVYDHVPFFNSIPALFRWNEYTLLVYGLLLGLLASDLGRDGRQGFPATRALLARWQARWPRFGRSPIPGRALTWVSPPARARPAGAVAALVVVTIVLVQNWAVVSEPPGTFQYPGEYTASFGYLSDRPLTGEVLAIPFGGIYDRAPWGGVSASAALLTPAYTGTDTVIFEAGTAPSLALDEFIGTGLSAGGSRNMTKFLGSANIQYVVTTHYSDWNYSSSSSYAPQLSYTSLANQTGLGTPTNISPVQSVYATGNSAGNLSFHSSYLVYFGADSILYSVLDSPWYPGPSMALINGSTAGAALTDLLTHAAGIVVSPRSLVGLGPSAIALARAHRVPIIEIISPSDYAGSGTELRPDAWNATGGVDLQFDAAHPNATINLASNLLSQAGYVNLTLTGQFAGPPNSAIRISFGATSVERNVTGAGVLRSRAVNVTGPGNLTPGQENSTQNYTGSLNASYATGTPIVNWTPMANASSFQYLRLNLTNLTGWNGLALDVQNRSNLSFEARIAYGSDWFRLPGYASLVPISPSLWQYRFLFPSGDFGMPASLLTHLGNLSYVEIGLPAPGLNGSLAISNVSLVATSPTRLASTSFGVVPSSTEQVTVSLPPTGRLGFLEVATDAFPLQGPFERDVSPQPNPSAMTYRSSSSGWGVLTMAQTYSPFWSLSGPGPASGVVADVGLTGWLINNSLGGVWQVAYSGDALESTGLVLEAALTPFALAPVVLVALVRRRSSSRAP